MHPPRYGQVIYTASTAYAYARTPIGGHGRSAEPWRGYLDDMLPLLDVKLLTPLLEPDAPSAAGSLAPLWSCGSRRSAKDRNARRPLRRPER